MLRLILVRPQQELISALQINETVKILLTMIIETGLGETCIRFNNIMVNLTILHVEFKGYYFILFSNSLIWTWKDKLPCVFS
jgi:hypothetical protein